MIKNIFFDLDDTIFDFQKAEHNAICQTMMHFGIEPNDALCQKYSEINLIHWKKLETGEITRNEVKTGRVKVFFNTLGIMADEKEAAKFYEKELSKGHYYIEGAHDLIKALSEKYQLFLISNGTASVQKSRIASSDLKLYMNDIFISEIIGYNKPDLRFFEKCFESIPNFKKEESIIIGDSLTSDILGGINAGVKTIWFNRFNLCPPNQNKPDYIIHHLNDFIPLLDKIQLIESIKAFRPWNEQEAKDQQLILSYIQSFKDIFSRNNPIAHMTASAWVVNPEKTKTLMVYHNIYQSWSWLGGHADDDTNLPGVALKEISEESGIPLDRLTLVSPDIYSLEVLTVDGHEKKGSYVSSHLHLNITYLIEANPSDPVFIKPDENSGVAWFSLEDAIKVSTEPWYQHRIYPKLNAKLI